MWSSIMQWPIMQQIAQWLEQNNPVFSRVVGIILFVWVVAILWTMKDIAARSNSVLVQVLCILLVGLWTPVVGLPLYLLFRPVRYKWDRLGWREALALQIIQCYACGTKNPLFHDYCVGCGSELTVKCKECKHHYQLHYEYCSSCGAPNTEE